jgi:hypothetical protein
MALLTKKGKKPKFLCDVHKFYTKPEKCNIGKCKVRYLLGGYINRPLPEGLSPDAIKTIIEHSKNKKLRNRIIQLTEGKFRLKILKDSDGKEGRKLIQVDKGGFPLSSRIIPCADLKLGAPRFLVIMCGGKEVLTAIPVEEVEKFVKNYESK